jgi:hypothetical protein
MAFLSGEYVFLSFPSLDCCFPCSHLSLSVAFASSPGRISTTYAGLVSSWMECSTSTPYDACSDEVTILFFSLFCLPLFISPFLLLSLFAVGC